MSKRKIKRIIVVLCGLLLLSCSIFGVIDINRFNEGKEPLFIICKEN